MIDVILIIMVAVVTWVVASDGAWGAGLTFICTIFSGLLAMNFFEPMANWFAVNLESLSAYADIVSLVGLFTIFAFATRMGTEYLAPNQIEIEGRVYQPVRWLFAAGTGYVTMAFLLTALHTSPLPREFIGFKPERKNLFNSVAPDRQWLGFTQRVSEKVLVSGRVFDGPRITLPGTPQTLWPSFPIRYASRRESLSQGTKGAANNPIIIIPPQGAGTNKPAPPVAF